MIDVIKRGVPYEERYFKVHCKRCTSVLKFKGAEEIKATDFNYIVCPVCTSWINTKKAWGMQP
jgi:Zn finger protein HypA/HybF involved in hydrogenase expression